MDCKTAQLLLTFARPKTAELGAREAEVLQQHLSACPACASLARSQAHADHHLGVALRAVPVPADLRQRLRLRLQEDRQAWYRQLPRRHPRWSAAAAALLLLAVGLGLYAALRPPQRLDLQLLAENWNSQVSAPREEVQRYFAERGYRVVPPPELNYHYLVAYQLAEFAGRQVPSLQFMRGPNSASIYILSGSQFDVRAAVEQPREGSGRFTIELRAGPANANVAYLIKYTGGSLDWLCNEEKASST